MSRAAAESRASTVDHLPQAIDLDRWLDQRSGDLSTPPSSLADCATCNVAAARPWGWQILPDGTIYRSYLAGAKESRVGTQWLYDANQGQWLWDSTLGARVGLLRYGTAGPFAVEGVQIDFEGATMLRLDLDNRNDLASTDFRAGVPITFGWGRYQTKVGYYHMSSHLGDEQALRTGTLAMRLNYVRDVLVWGHSYYINPDIRIYFEAGWAFYIKGGSKPWEFQFGLDYSPVYAVGFRGAPFFAINGHLRQEVNYGGNLVVQAGWQWRHRPAGPLLRVGLHYYNGESPQFEFFDEFEQQIGFGVWYDF